MENLVRKRHTGAFKVKVALEAIKEKKTTQELCQIYGVATSQIYAWKKQLENGAGELFEDRRKSENKQESIDQLHAKIGQLTVECDFLKKVLNR